MNNWLVFVGFGAAALAVPAFFYIGRVFERRAAQRARQGAQEVADKILADARRDAEAFRQSLLTSGNAEIARAREALDVEAARRREELSKGERRLEDQSRQLERKVDLSERREKELESKLAGVAGMEQKVAAQEQELQKSVLEQRRRLEAVAGLSAADAKKELVRVMEDEAKAEAANLVRNIKDQARREADREAKKIVAIAIQRIAAEQTAETTISTVTLPNDEMKGRIIGREGRNIRAFEQATGVDVIIDDTPDAVTVSCFDPVRREVARLAL